MLSAFADSGRHAFNWIFILFPSSPLLLPPPPPPPPSHRPVGLVVKASSLRVSDLGSIPPFNGDLFPGRHTTDLKLHTSLATLPGYRVSAGLVGPVSVYCDRVK